MRYSCASLLLLAGCSALSDFDRFEEGCVAVAETCDGADDDCDGNVDEDFDLTTDPIHCGSCGTVCTDPTPFCVDGACADACVAPRTECSASACVVLDDDVSHCGACDNACAAPPDASAACAAGTCGLTCDPGFGDCNDTVPDGCEVDFDTLSDCGACGNACFMDCEGRACDEVVALDAGRRHTCALSGRGRLICWGDNREGQLARDPGVVREELEAVVVDAGGAATALAAGEEHTCAIVAGEVRCWGSNSFGQLGDGTTTSSWMPVTVAGTAGATDLAANTRVTCMIRAGELSCWGTNIAGLLDPTRTADAVFSTPVRVPVPAGTLSTVACGRVHTCALIDTRVVCWGFDGMGQVSAGAGGTGFVEPAIAGPAIHVSAGGAHTCAAITGVGIQCWGDRRAGQLGVDCATAVCDPVHLVPTTDTLGPVTQMRAGDSQTCAVYASGQLLCWGSHLNGLLGGGLGAGPLVLHEGAYRVTAPGGQHTCALDAADVVSCWGIGQGRGVDMSGIFWTPMPISPLDD